MYKFVIGVDISKSTLDVGLKIADQKEIIHDSFLNKALGFKHFLEWAKPLVEDMNQLVVCIEHTGYYTHAFCDFLQKKNITFSLINPLQIKRSMGMRRGKTDKRDSEMIALYGIRFQDDLIVSKVLDKELLTLQLLLAQRKRLLNMELSLKRSTKHLKHCLPKSYNGKINKENLCLEKIIKGKRIDVEEEILRLIRENPPLDRNYKLLLSIPGVGKQTAQYTILYSSNFQKISEPRKFACYSGVVPFHHQSGTSINKPSRVSYYSNKTMKSLLNFAAMSAVKVDPELRKYYKKKVEDGKSKMSVLNAVRNKIVHRIFAVVKRGTPFVSKPVF